MVLLTLPRLVSGRELASTMVRALGDIRDADVVVDARSTTTGTGSFAARMVRDVLITYGAKRLMIIGAPREFADFFEESADKLHVRDRIEIARSMPAGSDA